MEWECGYHQPFIYYYYNENCLGVGPINAQKMYMYDNTR